MTRAPTITAFSGGFSGSTIGLKTRCKPTICRRNLRLLTVQLRASEAGGEALVVVGSVNADMVLQVERLPKEGETLAASNLMTFPGGKVDL